jgi:hypothetical protein
MNTRRYRSKKKKIISNKNKIYILITISIFIFIFTHNTRKNKKEDDLTLVTAYYQVKSRHTHQEYLDWLNNIVLLNKSIVFFTNKQLMDTLKSLRPKQLYYKTVFIQVEIEEFYSYKNYLKEFNETFKIDIEYKVHSVPLFLIWSEKCMFLKKVIENNYFNSKCFYWIDIGYFRENKTEMKKYLNNWPNTRKCYEDDRLVLGQVKYFPYSEQFNIINFNYISHQKLQKDINVAAGLFGGQIKKTLLFIKLYYEALHTFLNHNIFIGKEQNIFTYIAFSHPEIVKLVFANNNYFYLKKYFS